MQVRPSLRKRPCFTIYVDCNGRTRTVPTGDFVQSDYHRWAVTVLDNRSFGRYVALANTYKPGMLLVG